MCPPVIIWIFKFIVHQVHTDFSFYFKTSKSASRSDHPEDGIYGVWSLKNRNSIISWFSWFPNDDATMELTSKLFDFFCIILTFFILFLNLPIYTSISIAIRLPLMHLPHHSRNHPLRYSLRFNWTKIESEIK